MQELGALAWALVVLAPGMVYAGTPVVRGSFLLIDGGMIAGHERLTGCDHVLSDIHGRLDQGGVTNTLLVTPSTTTIRQELLRFAAMEGDVPRVVLFCGYTAVKDHDIFALGSGAAPDDNLAVEAVSIRAFSRVVGGASGLVALDLHASAPDASGGAALAGASDAWAADSSLPGRKLSAIDRAPDSASLLTGLLHAASLDPATLGMVDGAPLQESTPVRPVPAPLGVVPYPPASSALNAPLQESAPVQPAPAPLAAAPQSPASSALNAPLQESTPGQPVPAPLAAVPRPPVSSVLKTPLQESTPEQPVPAPLAVVPHPPASSALKPVIQMSRILQRIQVALLGRGFYFGQTNGIDNAATHTAIRQFQTTIGHAASGRLTPYELKRLLNG